MMLVLLAVPVVGLVGWAHRHLQLYGPSNVVIARARITPARWRSALLLAVLGLVALVVMRVLADAVTSGAPGWIWIVVLVLAWDAIKLGLVAVSVAMGCVLESCRPMSRQSPDDHELDRSDLATR